MQAIPAATLVIFLVKIWTGSCCIAGLSARLIDRKSLGDQGQGTYRVSATAMLACHYFSDRASTSSQTVSPLTSAPSVSQESIR